MAARTDAPTVLFIRPFVAVTVILTFLLSMFPRTVFDLWIWSFSRFTGIV